MTLNHELGIRSVGSFFHQTNWNNERPSIVSTPTESQPLPEEPARDPRSVSVHAFFAAINWANEAPIRDERPPENPHTIKYIMSQFHWD